MMRIRAISDLHGKLPFITECEVLLLGGDYAPLYTKEDAKRFYDTEFRDWLSKLPVKYKIGIAGNHDFVLEHNEEFARSLPWIYLKDEAIELETVRFYGTPWSVKVGQWAFQKEDKDLFDVYKQIPEKLDVLLSHGPAYGHLDKLRNGASVGSRALLNAVCDKRPDSVVFGHIHESRGIMQSGITRYYNATYLNEDMRPVYNTMNVILRG